MQSWFSWKGERSIDKGIWVTTLPGIARAEERNEQIEVAGRPGVLTILNGEDNHEPIRLTVVVTAPRNINLQPVLDWLTGGGDVVFSNQPDRAYEAQILDSVEFMNISNSLCQANVNFVCQPHKKAVPKEGKISKTLVSDTAQTIVNPGTVAARPKVKVTKSAAGNFTMSIGDSIMSFTSAPTVLVIDCDAEIILKSDGTLWAGTFSGDFFRIPKGSCEIESDVACTVEIEPNWRWK